MSKGNTTALRSESPDFFDLPHEEQLSILREEMAERKAHEAKIEARHAAERADWYRRNGADEWAVRTPAAERDKCIVCGGAMDPVAYMSDPIHKSCMGS